MANQEATVVRPAAGQQMVIPVAPALEQINLGFDLEGAVLAVQGQDLIITFNDGASLTLQGLISAAADPAAAPLLMQANGEPVPSYALLSSLEGGAEALETAAGGGGGGGGAGEYRSDPGAMYGSLDRLGGLDATSGRGLYPIADSDLDPIYVEDEGGDPGPGLGLVADAVAVAAGAPAAGPGAPAAGPGTPPVDVPGVDSPSVDPPTPLPSALPLSFSLSLNTYEDHSWAEASRAGDFVLPANASNRQEDSGDLAPDKDMQGRTIDSVNWGQANDRGQIPVEYNGEVIGWLVPNPADPANVTFILNNASDFVQSLSNHDADPANDKISVTVPVTVTDSEGFIYNAGIVINIHGDLQPSINVVEGYKDSLLITEVPAPATKASVEDTAEGGTPDADSFSLTGTVELGWGDGSQLQHFISVSNGQYGSLVLGQPYQNGEGQWLADWTYTPDPQKLPDLQQALADARADNQITDGASTDLALAGEEFTITIRDNDNDEDFTTLNLSFTGQDLAPLAQAYSAGVYKDGSTQVSGAELHQNPESVASISLTDLMTSLGDGAGSLNLGTAQYDSDAQKYYYDGAYGKLYDNGNGTFSYEVDAEVWASLKPGDKALTETFNFSYADADGDTSAGAINIAINPDIAPQATLVDLGSITELSDADYLLWLQNGLLPDAMVLSGELAPGGALTEGDGAHVQHELGLIDISGENPADVAATDGYVSLQGAYGTLILCVDPASADFGKFTYSADPAKLRPLTAEDAPTETFDYYYIDANGNRVESAITVELQGSQSGVTFKGTDSGAVFEEGFWGYTKDAGSELPADPAARKSVSGQLSFEIGDGELGDYTLSLLDGSSQPITPVSGVATFEHDLGTLTLNTDVTSADFGKWTFVLNNDAPEVQALSAEAVGNILASLQQEFGFSFSNNTTAGTYVGDIIVTIYGDYAPDAYAVSHLVADGDDATYIIDGHLVDPLIDPDNPKVDLGDGLAANHTFYAADADGDHFAYGSLDAGENITFGKEADGDQRDYVIMTGLYGVLTLYADGQYKYEADAAKVKALGLDDEGNPVVANDVFNYAVQDADNDFDASTITITVNGANDPPVPENKTKSTYEDTGVEGFGPVVVDGNLFELFSDPDEGDTLTITEIGGQKVTGAETTIVTEYGTYVVNTDQTSEEYGNFTFTAHSREEAEANGYNNLLEAYNNQNYGQDMTAKAPLNVTVVDSHDADATSTLTIDIVPNRFVESYQEVMDDGGNQVGTSGLIIPDAGKGHDSLVGDMGFVYLGEQPQPLTMNISLLMDKSSSMSTSGLWNGSKEAFVALIDELMAKVNEAGYDANGNPLLTINLQFVTFGQVAKSIVVEGLDADKAAALKATINGLSITNSTSGTDLNNTGQYTNYEAAFNEVANWQDSQQGENVVYFVTDGVPNSYTVDTIQRPGSYNACYIPYDYDGTGTVYWSTSGGANVVSTAPNSGYRLMNGDFYYRSNGGSWNLIANPVEGQVVYTGGGVNGSAGADAASQAAYDAMLAAANQGDDNGADIFAIGIATGNEANDAALLARINDYSTHDALFANDISDLLGHLQLVTESIFKDFDPMASVMDGGDGNDIVTGDSLNFLTATMMNTNGEAVTVYGVQALQQLALEAWQDANSTTNSPTDSQLADAMRQYVQEHHLEWAEDGHFDKSYVFTEVENEDGTTNWQLSDPDTDQPNIGRDVLIGGAGDDFIYGQNGNDILFGGKIATGEMLNAVVAWMNAKNMTNTYTRDNIAPLDVHSYLTATDENGVPNHEKWFLDSQENNAPGEDGNNLMLGGLGEDIMYGGSGADIMSGGAGADYMYGGGGNDVMYGGAGSDVFVWGVDSLHYEEVDGNFIYSGHDTDIIADWNFGDQIDLSALFGTGQDFTLNVQQVQVPSRTDDSEADPQDPELNDAILIQVLQRHTETVEGGEETSYTTVQDILVYLNADNPDNSGIDETNMMDKVLESIILEKDADGNPLTTASEAKEDNSELILTAEEEEHLLESLQTPAGEPLVVAGADDTTYKDVADVAPAADPVEEHIAQQQAAAKAAAETSQGG